MSKKTLSDFSCPINDDVERFLKNTAIEFCKQGISATHLVFASYKDDWVLVGYYTLANKLFTIPSGLHLSQSMKKRLLRFGTYIAEMKCYEIAAPLIAQLGKNYYCGYNKLITGDELLSIACESIRQLQMICGGRIAYLECENMPKLIAFYTRNGFCQFSTRELDKDERDVMKGDCLVQMLRYFH